MTAAVQEPTVVVDRLTKRYKGADVDAVRELAAGHRLTTLIGPGGSGKTRLATETARTDAAAPRTESQTAQRAEAQTAQRAEQPAAQRRELPNTAGALPLLALIGLGSLIGSRLMRRARQ